jgi:hypothetical protein
MRGSSRPESHLLCFTGQRVAQLEPVWLPSSQIGIPAPPLGRPRVEGKFLFVGNQKYWVRGVTYGTFQPNEGGDDYPDSRVLDRDFAAMVSSGFNTVRVYTVPPQRLLDVAAGHGLRVIVGLPWEQHVAFLDDPVTVNRIIASVREGVARCVGHAAVFCYAIGNEICAPVARWHGKRRIERFLARLGDVVRGCDPSALVTYVN